MCLCIFVLPIVYVDVDVNHDYQILMFREIFW